jgi:peptidoglycan/LPS O-acetylase OafA/YrhL
MPIASEASPRTNPHLGHIPELDGIRGIAIALVLLIHFWPNVGFWRAGLPLTELGWIGVDLFFALSGFLITGILLDSVERPDYYRRFYSRRAFRILPLYYLFLTTLFLFITYWHGGYYLSRLKTEWGSPIWFFIYLGNIISVQRGTFAPFAPLAPTWSLQIEEQFYICFPFLVRRLREKLWVLLVAIFFFALAWRVLMFVASPANSMIQYAGTFSRADSLAAGGLAAWMIRYARQDVMRRLVTWLMPISICSIIAMYCIAGASSNADFTRTVGFSLNAVTFASLILWAVQRRNQNSTALFRLGPLRFIGRISYGLYLLQLPVQAAVKIITGIPLGSMQRTPMQSLLWLTTAIAVAWISWRFFEGPLLAWGNRWTTAKASAGPVPSERESLPQDGELISTDRPLSASDHATHPALGGNEKHGTLFDYR